MSQLRPRPTLRVRTIRHRPDGTEIRPFPWANVAWAALALFNIAATILFFAHLTESTPR